MQQTQSVAIIVPSLNPDEKFLSLLADLQAEGLTDIVVVNDGSSTDYDRYFETARDMYGCTVLTHSVNQGKGRALKTAFNHLLGRRDACPCAVTVDSDGQHRIADILKVAEKVQANPDSLVLGCRDFLSKDNNIPARSRFGNRITSGVLHLLCGVKLSDTQTGLRGFSPATMRYFMTTKGERFEYETNMLLDARESGIAFHEVPIETVYIEENKSSHFNPLLDSFRIYAVFAKFILSSLSSWVVDISLFTLFFWLLSMFLHDNFVLFGISFAPDAFFATLAARVISAIFNYSLNKKRVFKSTKKGTLLRYAILSVSQVLIAGLITSFLLPLLNCNATLLKFAVDVVLFVLSFGLQRGWVFKS